ncbi:hypothetical protein L1987_41050 [Smallanthus sonchifolius]|uniref:Uncharacterized protein n=1 Tax=Smallanthus sonchifolius TaxID=185202 RepID=A0ACB9GUR0_9ASTR|nr:hypothetical protein L1987_41050 [Smallanthus sonchifolius]
MQSAITLAFSLTDDAVRMGTWSKVGDSGKKVVEAGEKFGDIEKKPFDGKRKNSGFPKNSSVSRRRDIRIPVRFMLRTRLVLLVEASTGGKEVWWKYKYTSPLQTSTLSQTPLILSLHKPADWMHFATD